MLLLKQSTAVTVKMGPFLDDTDGKTEETGLSIGQSDIKLSKNGGSFAQSNNSAGASHDTNGYYGVPLDTTDTNTLGTLRVFIHKSGALPVWQDFMVIPANVYDSLVGGSDKLQTDCREFGDSNLGLTTQMKADVNSECDTALSEYDAVVPADLPSNFADLSITAGTGLVDITQTAADKVWNSGTRVLTANTNLNDPSAADIADAIWDEDIENAHGNDASAGLLLRVLGSAISDRTNNANLNALLGVADTAGKDLPEQVWAEPTRALTDKADFSLASDQSSVTIGTVNALGTQAKADVNAECDTALSEYDAVVPADLPSNFADLSITASTGLVDITQSAADKVWSSATRSLTDKADFALSSASRAAIWDEQEANLSISFETLIYRIYTLLSHKMNITDATGAAALRNAGDTANIATSSITDDDTTTVRAAWSW